MIPRLLPSVLLTLAMTAPDAASAVDLKKKYEEQLVRWALEKTGLQLDPGPRGKVIERIVIMREEVIAQSDFWPNFINWFHVKTRDRVVRQELLVRVGQRWDAARVAESARNLRKLFVLAVVRAVPCRGSDAGKVVLLVATKDLWSIRLNMKVSMVGATVQQLLVQPTEQNFLGRNKQLSLRLRLQQLNVDGFRLRDKFSVGQLYIDERLFGTRLYFAEVLDLVFAGDVPCAGSVSANRLSGEVLRRTAGDLWCPTSEPGDLEGVYAYLRLWRPLYALDTRWGFGAWAWANVRQVRSYQQPGPVIRTASHERNGVTYHVPRVYDVREFFGAANVVRSFGRDIKFDIYGGAAAYSRHYAPPDPFPFDEATRQWYSETLLPLSEDAAMLFVTYHSRDTRYVKLFNIDSFALTEDFLLGHDVKLEGRFALGLTSVSQGYIEGRLEGSYRLYRKDNLLTAALTARTRYMPSLRAGGIDGPMVDWFLSAQIKNAFPRLWIGRFHLHLQSVMRHNDLLKNSIFLGGDTGLRGYPSLHFEGRNLLSVNAEYRSLPINLLTLHMGFVLFYDGGALYGGPDPADPTRDLPFTYRQTVGLGLRALFPQFDREVLRVDLGFPLSGSAGEFGTWFSVSFAQVWSTAPRVKSSTMIDP